MLRLNIKVAKKLGSVVAGALMSGFAMEAGQSLYRGLETKIEKLNKKKSEAAS